MEIAALIVRLLIAATFSVAAITKFADPQGTRKGIGDFGIPNWAARFLGILAPSVELCVAVLLFPPSTVLWGSSGAIALLLLFTAGISINLILGRKPNCNCFGQLHSEPIGWPTLARNCILLGGAGFVFWDSRHGPLMGILDWAKHLPTAELVGVVLGTATFAILAAQAVLTFNLLRQNGRLLLRMDALEAQIGGGIASQPPRSPLGLPIGSPAPSFELPTLRDGALLTLDALRAERKSMVLIFSDPDCGPCTALLPDIALWEREYAASLTIALISRGSEKANRAKTDGLKLRYVLLQKDREVAEEYKAMGTPGAVLISPEGRIASFLAMGSQAIAGLVAGKLPVPQLPANIEHGSGSAIPAQPAGLEIGTDAPSFKLPDLNGKMLDISSFKGRETLVLFWNPSCGFCARMLPELKSWEADSPADAPSLLVVSSGTAEANLSMGLSAPVVLDQAFASGRAFHVRGTPAAVLVDADGKIASEVASGAPAVFALVKAQRSIPA